MSTYRANLIVGGMSLKRRETFINDGGAAASSRRTGDLTLSRTDCETVVSCHPGLPMLHDDYLSRAKQTGSVQAPKHHICVSFEA